MITNSFVLHPKRRAVCSVGGGLSSTLELTEAVIDKYGRKNVDLVMCRLPNEDPDVWRLVEAVEDHYRVKIKMIGQNKTPFDIFFELGYINPVQGRGRADPCSKLLKRQVMAEHMVANYDPRYTTLCLGITAHEYSDRWFDIHKNWTRQGWTVDAPLADKPYINREWMIERCYKLFGFVPRLYIYGFDHNNCGGACIKAGQKSWARLLYYLPDVYQWWEDNENKFRREINPNIAILRHMVKGITYPLPLKELAESLYTKWLSLPEGQNPFESLPDTPACQYCEAI